MLSRNLISHLTGILLHKKTPIAAAAVVALALLVTGCDGLSSGDSKSSSSTSGSYGKRKGKSAGKSSSGKSRGGKDALDSLGLVGIQGDWYLPGDPANGGTQVLKINDSKATLKDDELSCPGDVKSDLSVTFVCMGTPLSGQFSLSDDGKTLKLRSNDDGSTDSFTHTKPV